MDTAPRDRSHEPGSIANRRLIDARLRLRSPVDMGKRMSRREVAEAMNAYLWATYRQRDTATAAYIGYYERGRNFWPNDRRREAWRHVLKVPDDAALGFYYNRRGPAPAAELETEEAELVSDYEPDADSPWYADGALLALAAGAVEADLGGDLVSGDDLATVTIRRRSLLVSLAGVTAAIGLGAPAPGGRRRLIGLSDVRRLSALTTLYRSMDFEFGGGALVADVGRFAERAGGLLEQTVPDEIRKPLLMAVADARYLAGWTAFDATAHADAQRHFAAAERFAMMSEDRMILAHIRYGQARQLQHLRHNTDALQVVRWAADGLRATPAMIVVLRGAEAASLAAIGDHNAAERALGEASEAFTSIKAGQEPEWLGTLEKGELLAQYGRVYRDMARSDERHGDAAVTWVTDAISEFGPQNVRSTVLNQIGLCSAYFLAGAPGEAIREGRRAQRQAEGLTSPRVRDRLANLRRDGRRFAGNPEVKTFLDGLPRPATRAA